MGLAGADRAALGDDSDETALSSTRETMGSHLLSRPPMLSLPRFRVSGPATGPPTAATKQRSSRDLSCHWKWGGPPEKAGFSLLSGEQPCRSGRLLTRAWCASGRVWVAAATDRCGGGSIDDTRQRRGFWAPYTAPRGRGGATVRLDGKHDFECSSCSGNGQSNLERPCPRQSCSTPADARGLVRSTR